MQDIMNASDVRLEWGKFIDEVVRDKPKVVKRNRDMLFAVSLEHLEQILQHYQLNLQIINEENSSYVVTLSELDVVSSGNSLEDAITTFAGDLIEQIVSAAFPFKFFELVGVRS